MRYFEVAPAKASWRWSGQYKAEHRWSLPGVDCPRCGPWAGMSAYPSVSLVGEVARMLEQARPTTTLEEYGRLAASVAPLLAASQPLTPGCSFGPLVGTAQGEFGPVTAWPSWELILREDALVAVREAGAHEVLAVPVELRAQDTLPALFLVETRPLGQVHPDSMKATGGSCGECGHPGEFEVAQNWALTQATLPSADVFRVEGTAVTVVSERFVAAVSRLGGSDVEYREVPLAQ